MKVFVRRKRSAVPVVGETGCDLHYGGVLVRRVYAFDPAADRAVFALVGMLPGRKRREPVAKFTGRRRGGPSPRRMTDDEVRAELVRLASSGSLPRRV